MTKVIAKIVKPEGAKSILNRSGTLMALIIVSVREVLPEAPWWGLALIALGVLVVEQVFNPSQKPA